MWGWIFLPQESSNIPTKVTCVFVIRRDIKILSNQLRTINAVDTFNWTGRTYSGFS